MNRAEFCGFQMIIDRRSWLKQSKSAFALRNLDSIPHSQYVAAMENAEQAS
jgi:hypothetical protein